MKRLSVGIVSVVVLTLGCTGIGDNGEPGTVTAAEPIVRGNPETGFPQVVLLEAQLLNGGKLRCSGSYIGPRLVLTAAHCVRPGLLNPNGVLVYYGSDWATDRAQLTTVPASWPAVGLGALGLVGA